MAKTLVSDMINYSLLYDYNYYTLSLNKAQFLVASGKFISVKEKEAKNISQKHYKTSLNIKMKLIKISGVSGSNGASLMTNASYHDARLSMKHSRFLH